MPQFITVCRHADEIHSLPLLLPETKPNESIRMTHAVPPPQQAGQLPDRYLWIDSIFHRLLFLGPLADLGVDVVVRSLLRTHPCNRLMID